MKRLFKSKPIFWIVILTLGLLLAACTPSAEKFNQEGNQAFEEQAYLEALQAYQSAQIENPELAQLYYNAANALYRQGLYAEALEQLQQALKYVDEESLAENSFFNMGNSLFNSQEFDTSVEAYKQALLLDPGDQEAKYNLELALQQQQQQQEQQNQEQQQDQSQNNDNQQNNQEQDQNNQDQNENQDQGQNQDQPQSDENQNEQEQQGDQSENQDQQENNEQDQNQNQDNGNGQPQDSENRDQGQQPGQIPPPGQRMTEEQAEQLLAAIAKDMETLQERLGRIMFVSKPPPVQDW